MTTWVVITWPTLVGTAPPGAEALAFYVVLGALMGLGAVAVTRLVYGIEDAFARLPLHWMWWPALGAVVVAGVTVLAVGGAVLPRTARAARL